MAKENWRVSMLKNYDNKEVSDCDKCKHDCFVKNCNGTCVDFERGEKVKDETKS